MNHQTLLMAIILTIGVLSCKQSTNKSEPSESIAEFEATSNSYLEAIKSVNVDSIMAFWDDDLQIFGRSSGEITGKNAFREITENSLRGIMEIPDVIVISREMDVSVDLAIEVVEFSETLIKDGGDPLYKNGKYLSIWNRIDGVWKISKMVYLQSNEGVNEDK